MAGPPALPRHLRLARPHGAHYLVDHTGTRRTTGTPPPPVLVELWHPPTGVQIDDDYPDAA